MTELWSVRQVMEHLGVASRSGALTALRRAGITATDYVKGPSGRPEARYDAVAVREAASSRPGRGARTDRDRGTAH